MAVSQQANGCLAMTVNKFLKNITALIATAAYYHMGRHLLENLIVSPVLSRGIHYVWLENCNFRFKILWVMLSEFCRISSRFIARCL